MILIKIVCDFFFFFFQAEDGIRDVAVTGVQTCALPIYSSLAPALLRSGANELWVRVAQPAPGDSLRFPRPKIGPYAELAPAFNHRFFWLRSEERRVGKECRCRWAW